MRNELMVLSIVVALAAATPLHAQGPLASGGPTGEPRSVLVIRAVFADETAPHPKGIGGANGYLTPGQAQQMLGDTASFEAAQSYGALQLDLAGSDITPTVQLPITRAQGVTWTNILTAGVEASRAIGYDPVDYDLAILAFSHLPQIPWAGLSTAPILMNGMWSTSTMRHEIGHRIGVGHTSFHVAADHDILGPGATWVKADPFDVMGGSGWDNPAAHFAAARKADLGWLPDARVATVTASGAYRLHAHDATIASGLQALLIKDVAHDEEFWIEARQLAVPAGIEPRPRKNEGVLVYRRALDAGPWDVIELLDFTPETHPDPASQNGQDPHRDDAPLVVGQTFSHRGLDLHVTPVARHSAWPPSIDVVVNVGPFPQNAAPVLELSAGGTLQVAVGQGVELHATATDPNGDELALYWDLGDGGFAMQVDHVTHGFETPGEYVVRCIASDMRGGTATHSVIVRAGNPATRRISGSVRDVFGAPLDNILVHAGERYAYTDSDGHYTLTGLAGGNVLVGAGSPGLDFLPANADVSPIGDPTGIDFVGFVEPGDAPANLPPTIAMTPKSGVPAAGAELTLVFGDPDGASSLASASIDLEWSGGSARLFPDLFEDWPQVTGRELFSISVAPDTGSYVLTLHPELAHWFTTLNTASYVIKAKATDDAGHQTVETAVYSSGAGATDSSN